MKISKENTLVRHCTLLSNARDVVVLRNKALKK
jgi:hypothetical protein